MRSPEIFRRRPAASAIGLIACAVILGALFLYWDYSRRFESTDDAFIAARQYAIAPKISGYIVDVPVTDNQHVEAGATIARIDERDYKVALDQAVAAIGAAQASISSADAQLGVQKAQIEAGEAKVAQVKAALAFAQEQADRYGDLAAKGSGSVQNKQMTISQLHEQQANLIGAQASLDVARKQVETIAAQRKNAEAQLAQARARRDQAALDLSHTTVTVSEAGRVVQLSAARGQLAQPGAAVSMFVPDHLWVAANFKETQLDRLRPGQPAHMRIDAYPGHKIEGVVASVQPGSGTAFSLLPAENATGNYVKIVQRVPVKIEMKNPPKDVSLGPGMSVVPDVRVDPAPSLYERLRNAL
ncbi:MAG: HlyD family secretion protein [Rhodoblastus sp.]